ncbi:uncharacterized protein KZ484_007918 [Pholidichthys leucotaenia]
MLAILLGSNGTAGLLQKIIRENSPPVILPCNGSVTGNLTWIREHKGSEVNILTADADRQILHNHDSRYSLLPNQSLVIDRPVPSDSGKYLCDNKPAVQLTVIEGPRKPQPTLTEQKLLTLLGLGIGLAALYVIVTILVVSVRRCGSKQRGNEDTSHPEDHKMEGVSFQSTTDIDEKGHTYDYILDGVGFQPKLGVERSVPTTAGYSLATFPGAPQENNSLYSLLGNPNGPGNNPKYMFSYT